MVDAAKTTVRRLMGGEGAGASVGGRMALKRRDVEKLKTFGFDKVAAVLCYSKELAR
jgi:hypothetical protein